MNWGRPRLGAAERRQRLRECLAGHRPVVAPGVYDPISVKLAAQAGFEVLFATGYGMVAAGLGLPDAGLANGTDMLSQIRPMTQASDAALICDADTGYGGLLNVMHTVRSYEEAGAAAIQLEDQVYPKRCGHMSGRQVIPAAQAEARVRVALETREDPNLLIVARTDARTEHGLDEALRRAERFARAGADLVFVEGPESLAEVEQIAASVDVPTVLNVGHGARLPLLTPQQAGELGVGLVLYPTLALLAASQAAAQVYAGLQASGVPEAAYYPFADFSRLMGFDWVAQFDARYQALDQEET